MSKAKQSWHRFQNPEYSPRWYIDVTLVYVHIIVETWKMYLKTLDKFF